MRITEFMAANGGAVLDEKAIRAIFEADCASAKQARPTPVFALARPAANTHRFHLKRSDIPFSTRWRTTARRAWPNAAC